ncbi:FHA domain-containing protein [Serinicoccus kebangsaanensis]|uniref:FHA domain-containing protein n=1 Tax=Serinicoccus kebangsaanensis TaxID=2602069 RepID=UPI00124CA751|nr:FHA domain-containing protein [Serinicoccus kebangsaanensis]
MGQLHIDADLRLTISVPETDGRPSEHFSATVQGTGTELQVQLDELGGVPLGLGRRAATDIVSDIAAAAADAGLTVSIAGPDGPVLSLGQVRSRLLDRAVTGSRHVAVRDRRAALRLLRAARTDGPSLADLLPPGTPWPLAPTVARLRRRRVTTTHDPLGGGEPRLVYYRPPGPEQGAPRLVAPLRRGTTTIGSAPDNDVVVPGLAARHAEIRRDATTDEYLLHAVEDVASVGGAPAHDGIVLRTGATVTCGDQTFVYVREEYADHGRPYGGREGGEFSRQRPQSRPRRYER